MRLIDATSLEKILNLRREQCSNDYGSLAGAVAGCLKLVQVQPTIAPPPNDPLTLEDLCPRCDGFARELDASALVLRELRRMAAEQEAPPPPAPPDTAPPAPRGKAAREKREILAAVEAYRGEHGLGSISTLARLAKVGEGELRDMISCAPVPIATWRKVGRALGVAGTRKPEEGTA